MRTERKNARSHFKASVLIKPLSGDVTIGPCFSRDISLSGMFVQTKSRIPKQTKCKLRIDVKEYEKANDFMIIEALVVRHAEAGMGFRFTEVDADTFNILTEIIQESDNFDQDQDEVSDTH